VVALAEEFRPDVALIGLIMPELDGVKLSQQLSPRFPTLKIVFTADTVEEGILRSLFDSGIGCDTLDVPCEQKDMLEMMETWSVGLDHIDPATRLRDAKHFQMALTRWCGSPLCFMRSIIFIELCQSTNG